MLTAVCGVQLRAETVSDRSAWIAALQMCKEQLGGSLSPTIRSSLSSSRRTSLSQGRVAEEVMQCVDKVSGVLADLGLSAVDSRRVSEMMVECVSQLHTRSRREVLTPFFPLSPAAKIRHAHAAIRGVWC